MKPKLKPIPKFKSEDEEREFWDTHEALDYFDTSKGEPVVFPNLKLTNEAVDRDYQKTLTP